MLSSKCVALCLFLCVSFSVLAKQPIDDIRALLETEPSKALEQAQELWQGQTANKDNYDEGMLLIDAYLANDQVDLTAPLFNAFLSLNALKLHQLAAVLIKKVRLSRKSKISDDFLKIIKQADDVIAQLVHESSQKDALDLLVKLNQEVGYVYYFASEFNRAEVYFLTALKYIDKNNFKSVSNLLNTIGVIYAQQAQLAESAQYMLDSINMLEANGLPVGSDRYQNLGSLYFGLKDYEKTIAYCQKALNLQQVNDKSTAALYSNMAAAQIESGKLEEAVQNLHKSIEIGTELGITTASARNNLGFVYKELGQYEDALVQLNLSAKELDDVDNSDLKGVSFKSRADVYAAMKNYDKALELYEKAHAAFMQNDLKLKRVELYPQLIAVLKTKGLYQRAFDMLQEYKILNDELNDIESTKEVNEVLTRFEVEKKEQELVNSELVREKQQQDIVLLNNKNEFELKIRYLMYVLVGALVVVLLLVYRSWRFRGKVNQVLLDKNNRIEKQHHQLITLNDQLKNQAEIDSLTGLKNRRFITHFIAEECAKQPMTHSQWALVIIDIDDFKWVNDHFGHQKGDDVLVQFARCLNQLKGPNDIVARWGGEEFLWLVEQSDTNSGQDSCDTFQNLLSELAWFKDDDRKVTCSMGFCHFPLVALNFEDWDAALRLADYALYQAKNAGKNQWYGFKVIDNNIAYEDIKNVDGLVKGKRIQVIGKQD